MKRILRYLKPFAGRMTGGFSVKVAATVIELFIPYILSHILKFVVVKERVELVILWGGLMVVCAASACVLNIVANRMAARVARNFSERLRHDLFRSTLHLSAAGLDHFTVPSLEARITSDTYNLHHFVGIIQRMGVRAPIMLCGGIVITLCMDAYLSLAMIAVLPFIFISVYTVSRCGVPLYKKVQKSVDGMVRVVREDAMGIRVIKALSKTEYEKRRFENVNEELSRAERRAGLTMGISNPVMTLFMNLGTVAVITLAASRVHNGLSDAETVIAFVQYFTMISMAMMALTRIFIMYTKSAASAGRIAEVLEHGSEITLHTEAEYPSVETDARIAFDGVRFSYNGRQNDLTDIGFSVPRGGKLGIIGATGSGKSTVVRLLLRLYDVDGGSVRIDGRDVRTIPREELYAMFGTVLQNDFLYADTIAENIRFGRDISDEEVERAARIAQAHDFITSFPDGYGHMLTQKGSNLSGGQKQRLLIARAVAGRPKILILDDSSSALDYKTDARLRHALAAEAGDTTVVTVAQRVSSVKDSDVILVLEEGRIIGCGKHEELLDSCVEYKEISDSQMGGAILE